MNKIELDKYRLDQRTKTTLFVSGLIVALILALSNSQYTGEAFALLAGLITGSSIKD